jgi:YVTN family beta-propeller protein
MRIKTILLLSLAACGGSSSGDDDPDAGGEQLAHTLFVARSGTLVSFDLATGDERPGTVTDVTGPVDLQALRDGVVMVNLTGENAVLAVDGRTMLEEARIPSSTDGGLRPVHSFITPDRRFWFALNDGDGTAASNTASIIDIRDGAAGRFQRRGEFALGVGHHKAAFSSARDRIVVSNIGDCANVMTVYDYSDPTDVQAVGTLTAVEAGWDGVTRMCDPTYQNGFPPAPHGCATSPLSGKIYCSLTSTGETVVVDIDADEPTFEILATNGSGGGYTSMHPGGRYAYTLQETPREGDGGTACGIGQVAVIDTMTDTVAAELPLFYTGPSCTTALTGETSESANPGHIYFSHGGEHAFIALSGGFMDAAARVDQLVVLDTSDAADPTQLPSVEVGVGTGHGTGTIDGIGDKMYVVGQIDGTVSEIDCETLEVTRTLDVGDEPAQVATFGDAEGPSHQTGPLD